MDKPALVQPTLDKIDVEGLRRDISKFRQHYPEQAANSWQNWLDRVHDLVELPDEWEWPVDKLSDADHVRPTAADTTAPEHLTQLRNKELQQTREVQSLYQIMYDCSVAGLQSQDFAENKCSP